MSEHPKLPVHGLGRIAIAEASERRGALDPRELARLSPRATSKRREEFFAGRLVAHEALARLREQAPELPSRLLVLAEQGEQRGRPRVVDEGLHEVGVHVSISHCEPLAIAVAARVPIGIDLVRVEAQSPAFVREAFCADELAAWAEQLEARPSDPLVITHAFAAKEALLKWLGTGFGLPLQAVASWPSERLASAGEASGELLVRTPMGARTLAFRRWFDAELLVLLVA